MTKPNNDRYIEFSDQVSQDFKDGFEFGMKMVKVFKPDKPRAETDRKQLG